MAEIAIRVVEGGKLDDWIESWLSSLSPATKRAYRADALTFLRWFGSENLGAITREDCHRYKRFLIERHTKPATVNRQLAALRSLLGEAVRYGITPNNAAGGIKGYRQAGISKRTPAPSVDGVNALLASIGTDRLIDVRDRAIIYLAANMGLRREEIAALTTGSISQDQGCVLLTVVGKGTKTRRCRIPDSVLSAVRAWTDRAELRDDVPLIQPIESKKPTGRKIHASTIYTIIGRRLAAAGITGYSPHGFRAFFITEGRRGGADLYAMQRFVGHSDPRTTEGYDRARRDIEDSVGECVHLEDTE
jgi:integrase/recombinase XerD